jgi:uncharacterized protein (TIGR01777 family)
MHILVSGASGLIGSHLVPELLRAGHTVGRLVRDKSKLGDYDLLWNPREPLDSNLVSQFDAIVHLAGRNIGSTRWSEEQAREVFDSRVLGTRMVAEAAARAFADKGRPMVMVSASAVGYYGSRGDEMLTEDSAPGTGYLAETGVAWEAATSAAENAGVRVVMLRTGLVLAKEGGALPRMLKPFRLGVGGRMASGRHYWPWIHIDDVVGVIVTALFNERLRGPINVVVPGAPRNSEFTQALAEVLKRPAVFVVPKFAGRLMLGSIADDILFSSQRVVPKRLGELPYTFRFPSLRDALRDLVG